MLVQGQSLGATRWHGEDDADAWMASIGLPDSLSMMLEPHHSFLMLSSRRILDILAAALSAFAEHRPDRASEFREFAEILATDSSSMWATAPAEEHPLGVHPWCFGDCTYWQLWRLSAEEAERVAAALRADSHPAVIVARLEEYVPFGGDLFTARMLLEALEMHDAEGEVLVVRDSLRAWIARVA